MRRALDLDQLDTLVDPVTVGVGGPASGADIDRSAPWLYPRIPPDKLIDREAHERVCSEQVWHYLDSPPWNDPELRGAKWPISIELDGSYPETHVVVTMGYLYRRSPQHHRYPIWKAYTDHGLPDDGSIPTPELFGVNVALWIMES